MSYTPFLTASAVDRFLLCPASATLPKVYSESAAATAGTEAHARILQPGCLPAAVLRWYGREPGYEGALGRCAETGDVTFWGHNLDRAYAPTGPLWVCGTYDAAERRRSQDRLGPGARRPARAGELWPAPAAGGAPVALGDGQQPQREAGA